MIQSAKIGANTEKKQTTLLPKAKKKEEVLHAWPHAFIPFSCAHISLTSYSHS